MKLRTLTLTAALLSASAFAWLSPAAAVPLGATVGSITSVAQPQQDNMLIQVQRRRGGGGDVGAGVAAGIVGGVIGGIIANEAVRQQNEAVQQEDDSDQAVAYCMRRFKSYNPSTGTYIGFDGQAHPCP
jgi:BA14K-like protein